LLFGLFVAVCGCASRDAKIGEWQAEEARQTLQFLSDGRLIGTDDFGRPISGTFEPLGDDRFRLKMDITALDKQTGTKTVDHSEGVCKIEVQGDELAIIEEGGPTIHYKRKR
jgi:hypothetical protein